MYTTQPGDLLSRRKGAVTHYGVAVHNGQVVDIMPGGRPRLVDLHTFAAGEVVSITAPEAIERAAIVIRAYAALNDEREYDLLLNNCENLKNRIANGKSVSETVLFLSGIALLTAVGYVLSRR